MSRALAVRGASTWLKRGRWSGAAGVASGVDYPRSAAFTTPIPASPVLDSNNAGLVQTLSVGGNRNLAAKQFAIARYVLPANDTTTPSYRWSDGTLVIDNQGTDWSTGDWGFNDLANIDVRCPADATAPLGSDKSVVVHDMNRGLVYDFWGFRRIDATHIGCFWGGVYKVNGDGSSRNPLYAGNAAAGDRWAKPYPQPLTRGTGSGMVADLGLIRIDEMQAAIAAETSLPHAMVFSTDAAAAPANSGPYRFPATTTDGNNYAGVAFPIEEGTRTQLDPTLNPNAYGLSAYQRVLFRTWQTYGAYCIDIGGARIAMYAEMVKPGDADYWASVGAAGDYPSLGPIPFGSLRVLRHWHGGADAIYPADPSLS